MFILSPQEPLSVLLLPWARAMVPELHVDNMFSTYHQAIQFQRRRHPLAHHLLELGAARCEVWALVLVAVGEDHVLHGFILPVVSVSV